MSGHQARQVQLDSAHKVLYSVPDASASKAGVLSSGFGFPEIKCDSDHCHILLPYLGAAMRRVARTSSDRDQVSNPFMRCIRFCNIMASSVSGAERVEVLSLQDMVGLLGPFVFQKHWHINKMLTNDKLRIDIFMKFKIYLSHQQSNHLHVR